MFSIVKLGHTAARLLLVSSLAIVMVACDDDSSPAGPSENDEPQEQPGILPASEEFETYPAFLMQDLDGLFATSQVMTSFGSDPDPSFPFYSGVAMIRGEGQNLFDTKINGYPLAVAEVPGWTAGFPPIGFEPERTRFENDGVKTHNFWSSGRDDAPIFSVDMRTLEPIELTSPFGDETIDKNSDLVIKWSDPDPTGDYYYTLNVYVSPERPGYSVFLDKDQLSHTVPAINFQTILNNPGGIRVQIGKVRYEKRTLSGGEYLFGVAWATEPVFLWAE